MSSPCQKTLVGLALASVLATGCEPPPVVPTADRRQNQQLSRIDGQVVVQSRARGNAIVLLYDADRPPPPEGAGRPLSFTVIPAERLFGPADPNASGPFTAPFTFSLVAPGRYLLRGFIDADTCSTGARPCHTPDFIPWYGVTSEPNAGDVGGAAVDALTRAPRVVEIAAGPDGALQAATGITVSFSDSSTVPVDRPAFTVVGDRRFDPATGSKVLELRPLQLHEGVVDVRPPAMIVRYRDDNGDGKPDDTNGDGQVDPQDLWPRVLVRKLAGGQELTGAQRLADENDLDRDGILDPEGADYPRADGTRDGLPDQVVLAAMLHPSVLDALRNPDGTPRMEAVTVPSLSVVVLPRALDVRDPLHPMDLRSVPSGRYALTLVQFTGQTWRVPNELWPTLASESGLPSLESQSFVLEVP
ncbi:hypothetical protein JQX13_03440 [Archangium violaceum]|uniref:hypothetical protein n=1 Tax=Archangium violaceum TaxID=83451 RepID=UPI00193C37FE|nr:hypothetical protein [Archangium violaceum]QRK09224.1 hypothetical protein JQX13_03440 [Archangium violaceum]